MAFEILSFFFQFLPQSALQSAVDTYSTQTISKSAVVLIKAWNNNDQNRLSATNLFGLYSPFPVFSAG